MVVPSPAASFVFVAASLVRLAPIFSNLSSRSISLATVTPSLVTVGVPNDLSRITLRPFGHIVTFTASATTLTPAYTAFLASSPKCICFAMILNSKK